MVPAVWQWWESELERRHLLSRAICLHKAHTMQRDQPTSRLPTYLEARVAAGQALPSVEVVLPQLEEQHEEGKEEEGEGTQVGPCGKRKAVGEPGDQHEAGTAEEEEAHVMLQHVLDGLNEELVTELLEGLH
jgi:hypothetical protein